MSPRTTRAQGGRVRTVLGDVVRCLRFYSRIPVPAMAWENDPHGPPDFRAMPRIVPVAGAAIGCFGAATVVAGNALGFGAWLSAALATATLVLVTGAFHEDGLADTADGFGGGATAERRLEIMKDSRIGSYGGVALILASALRIGCLAEVTERLGAMGGAAAVVMVASQSRTAALIVMTLLPPARTAGSSYAAGQAPAVSLLVASLVCAAVAILMAFVTSLPGNGVALAFVLAAAVALYVARLSKRLIGGQTGDVAGAAQQVAEIAAYLGLLIAARP